MRYNIYLIRHGKTAGNLRQEYIGTTDEPLCADGIKELNELKHSGKYSEVDWVYVSPMRRCLETKDIIYPNTPFTVIPDLKECNFGTFEQKTYDELKDNIDYQKWLNQERGFTFPKGETPDGFIERCVLGFAGIVAEIMREEIRHSALIIHGGTIMSILDRYTEEDKTFFEWHAKNGHGYRIVINKQTWLSPKKLFEVSEI